MKRFLLVIPFLLVTALAALIVAPSFIDWNSYKGEIQAQIKTHTGYDVELKGDLSFSLLPEPTLYIEDAHVKAGDKPLASFEQLGIHALPGPLLSGEVVISSVTLVKPDISLAVAADGGQSWMTPELGAMMAGGEKKPAAQTPQPQGGAESKFLKSVSLQNVNIEQGRFVFTDAKAAQPFAVENIDLKVKAETFRGPYEVSGQILYGGQPLTLTAQLGEIIPGGKSVSVNAKLGYGGLDVDYAGALETVEPFGVQGDVTIGTASLSKTLAGYGVKGVSLSPDTMALKGIVTADKNGAAFRNAKLDIAGQSLEANISAKFSPLAIQVGFIGSAPLDIDALMPKAAKSSGGASSSGGVAGGGGTAFDPTKILPEKIALPSGVNAIIAAEFPGLIYGGQNLGAADIKISLKDGRVLTNVGLPKMPGSGSISVAADLGSTKDGRSELIVSAKGSSADLPATLKSVSGGKESAVAFKKADAKIEAYLAPGKLQFKDSVVTVDGQTYDLSGVMQGQKLLANVGVHGGKLSLQTTVQGGSFLGDATVQVTHPNLAQGLYKLGGSKGSPNPNLAQPVDVFAKVNQNGARYDLSEVTAKLGEASLTGNLTYDGSSGKPNITGAFKGGDLSFASQVTQGSGGSAAASGGSAPKSASGARWSTDPIDVAWLNSANADVSLEASSLRYGNWNLTNPKLAFVLKDGVLDVKNLAAGLYGGTVALNATLKADQAGALVLNANTDVANVQIEPMTQSMVGSKLVKGKGAVSMKTVIAATGKTQAQLVSALSGNGTVSGAGLVLEGFDLSNFAEALSADLKPGESLEGLWKGVSSGGSTAFDKAEGSYTIANGVITIDKLAMSSAKLALGMTGTIDLPKWYLKTASNITLAQKPDIPPFTINLAGPLDNPGQTFAEGALTDYVSRKLTRKLEKEFTKKLGNNPLGQALGEALGGAAGTLLGVQSGVTTQEQRQQLQQQQIERYEERNKDPNAPAPVVDPNAPAAAQPVPAQQQPAKPITPEETFNLLLDGMLNQQ